MIREIVSGTDILSLEDAKRWLRVDGHQDDRDISQAITEARAYCEAQSAQIFRHMVQLESYLPQWPNERGQVPTIEDVPVRRDRMLQRSRFFFSRPPFVSGTSVDVCYYDTAGVSRTLAATAHRIVESTTSESYLEFDGNTTLPTTACRDDAVSIRWWAGYPHDAPGPGALLCLKNVLRAVWDGDLEMRTWEYFDALLSRFDHGQYA